MTDIIDVMYRFRDMAGQSADTLRAAVADAQAVLDRLDAFADGAEHGAELLASSDVFPTWKPDDPPESSGLTRLQPKSKPEPAPPETPSDTAHPDSYSTDPWPEPDPEREGETP